MADPKDLVMLNSKQSNKLMMPLKLMDNQSMKENSKLISPPKDHTKKKKVKKENLEENNQIEVNLDSKEKENNLEIENKKNTLENKKDNKNPELKSLEKNLLPCLLET
jgi:hypothetical protein